ncbi:hypothetical protein Tco_0859572 [Tanacetum coccineum]|uniref:Uncharacterized protein n=1 Tax=Tanacetum coccineum TaxID=301880 RepID=A0ABQ5BCG6_9ASTR
MHKIHQTQIDCILVSGRFLSKSSSYHNLHGFSENPVYVMPGFLGYPMHDPQSDSANSKNKQSSGTDEERYSESDEDEGDNTVENKTCRYRTNKNCFWVEKLGMRDFKLDTQDQTLKGYMQNVLLTHVGGFFEHIYPRSDPQKVSFYTVTGIYSNAPSVYSSHCTPLPNVFWTVSLQDFLGKIVVL